MDVFLKRAWAEVDLDKIEYNYEKIRSIIPKDTKIMAVIKANANNLGDIAIARALEKYTDDWYAVSNLNEAVTVRESGSSKNILILGFTPLESDYIKILGENKITQTIVSYEYAEILNNLAKENNLVIDVNIKLDTGMSRIGLLCYDENFDSAIEQAKKIYSMSNLNVTGIYTHIATLYEIDKISDEFSRLQFKRFIKVTDKLEKLGYNIGLRHCCNSAGVINMPDMALDMVRSGTLIFGAMTEGYMREKAEFKETITIKAIIGCVKEVKKGSFISYSRSYEAPRDMKLAIVTVGYSDICRIGLKQGKVIVNDSICPVVGSVCMDQMIVDITDVDDVKMGDEVILVGEKGDLKISIDEFGEFMDTEANEAYCHLTKRLPHVYIKDGQVVSWVEYVAKEHNTDN